NNADAHRPTVAATPRAWLTQHNKEFKALDAKLSSLEVELDMTQAEMNIGKPCKACGQPMSEAVLKQKARRLEQEIERIRSDHTNLKTHVAWLTKVISENEKQPNPYEDQL